MDNVVILPKISIGRNFIPKEFCGVGQDEYHIRNQQEQNAKKQWRNLRFNEIEVLIRNNNTSDNWNDLLVSEEFDPNLLRDNDFFGLVRIGTLRNVILQHHDMQIPAGISKSRIISCDIGDDVAIHNVRYLSHFIISNRCILANIDEMHTSNHAKFGNGILKDGEFEDVRVWMELMNEGGGRKVLPFDGIIPADAYMWAKYRDDAKLLDTLKSITQKRFDSRRGFYGVMGEQSVVKNSRIIKDTKIGDYAYVKGANKIKNVSINSSASEQTQIGEGVELVNGIIGFGCKIFYGCKAVRFVLGNNSNLKYGARLINSFLGENSTISCCEVLNNLIFPAHEQHHNNSFLIASLVMGQSNIAAGATIGSNHNTRANDNEIQAGRGFWPGLCTSLKHSSKFASFVLLAKADYPHELNISLPFSLVNNNASKNQLEIVPAFWWMHNMYALARNSWKFVVRDKRKNKTQHVEFDPLAPDTAEEIIIACKNMELWAGKTMARNSPLKSEMLDEQKLGIAGKKYLLDKPNAKTDSLEIFAENIEKSSRKCIIASAQNAYKAYVDMLLYYAVSNCMLYIKDTAGATFDSMCKALAGRREILWINFGGQIITAEDADKLRSDICSGVLASWDSIHARYDELWKDYPLQKQKHAFAVLCFLMGSDSVTLSQWANALDAVVCIQEYKCEQVFRTRQKDDDNEFRKATYRNSDEMKATVVLAENDPFIKLVREETAAFKALALDIRGRTL